MIEVIALIFLCRINGRLATRKGLKASTWRLYTILAWIAAEIVGVVMGLLLFGQSNIGGLMLFSVACAFGGFLFIKYLLDQRPDSLEDDIERVGIDDLRPPAK